jgi:Ca2+-binding RTX toxin-like protein
VLRLAETTDRTVAITVAERKSGSSVLTFVLSDGVNDVTFDIGVQVGTSADDGLTGTDGSDLLLGGNGADALSGLGGADVLCGGNGNDALKGGDGADLLSGDRGDDSLTGDAGADVFSAGTGADTSTDFSATDGDTADGPSPARVRGSLSRS